MPEQLKVQEFESAGKESVPAFPPVRFRIIELRDRDDRPVFKAKRGTMTYDGIILGCPGWFVWNAVLALDESGFEIEGKELQCSTREEMMSALQGIVDAERAAQQAALEAAQAREDGVSATGSTLRRVSVEEVAL